MMLVTMKAVTRLTMVLGAGDNESDDKGGHGAGGNDSDYKPASNDGTATPTPKLAK
jgi:hypothetical protein